MKTAHFTGHRPDKLRGGYSYYTTSNIELGHAIRNTMIFLIEDYGVKRFICGGALGVDQIACLVGIKLKEAYPHIFIELALPYRNMDRNWKNDDLTEVHRRSLKEADIVTVVDEIDYYKVNGVDDGVYHPAKLQKRNEYMVHNSDITIAIWNGENKGGTYNCIKSSALNGKDLLIIPIDNGIINEEEWTIEQEDWIKGVNSDD